MADADVLERTRSLSKRVSKDSLFPEANMYASEIPIPKIFMMIGAVPQRGLGCKTRDVTFVLAKPS